MISLRKASNPMSLLVGNWMNPPALWHSRTLPMLILFFFLNEPAPPEIYPLPLHAALPISAATLNEVSSGRFRLGIGVSHKSAMEAMLGLRLVEPLGVMREYVAVLRGALAEGTDFQGGHYRVRWSLALPKRPPAPPIYLAALSVKMLELAGEIADGAVLWLCPPAYVRDVALPALERGRRRAGKPLAGFEIVAAVPLALSRRPPAPTSAVRRGANRLRGQ